MFPESSFLGTYKPKYKYTPKIRRLILPASHFLVHHHLEIAILETKRSYKITSNPFDEGNGLDIGVSQSIAKVYYFIPKKHLYENRSPAVPGLVSRGNYPDNPALKPRDQGNTAIHNEISIQSTPFATITIRVAKKFKQKRKGVSSYLP